MIVQRVLPAVERIIKRSHESDVSWKCKNTNFDQSANCCIELFIDNLVIFFNARSLSFYPYHITRSQFSGVWRGKHINSSMTVCVYLLVSFERGRTGADHCDKLHMKGSKRMEDISKEILIALHEGAELSLKLTMDTTFQGLHCILSDRAQIQLFSEMPRMAYFTVKLDYAFKRFQCLNFLF